MRLRTPDIDPKGEKDASGRPAPISGRLNSRNRSSELSEKFTKGDSDVFILNDQAMNRLESSEQYGQDADGNPLNNEKDKPLSEPGIGQKKFGGRRVFSLPDEGGRRRYAVSGSEFPDETQSARARLDAADRPKPVAATGSSSGSGEQNYEGRTGPKETRPLTPEEQANQDYQMALARAKKSPNDEEAMNAVDRAKTKLKDFGKVQLGSSYDEAAFQEKLRRGEQRKNSR